MSFELCSNWKLPELIVRIGQVAEARGMRAWVIGGWVRDALLGSAGTDIDIVVEAADGGWKLAQAASRELGREFSLKPPIRYRRTGAALLRHQNLCLEFTPTRISSYRSDGKRDETPGSFQEDVEHRDFTVNTLALELPSGRIVDPVGRGLADLQDRIVDTPVEPGRTFQDDPLRIMRAARFACSRGFTLHERLFKAARQWAPELKGIKVAPERTGIELVKILSSSDPVLGIDLLLGLGACQEIMPEVAALAGLEQPPEYHHKDVYLHTLSVLYGVSQKTEDPVIRLAALLHDIGKARTRSLRRSRGRMRWTFHNHDVVGARMARHLVRRLKLASALQMEQRALEEVLFVTVRHHLAHLEAHNWADAAVRRFVHKAGKHLEALFTVMECDIVGHKTPETKGFMALKAKIEQVNAKDLTEEKTRPAVDGYSLMSRYDRPAGRWLGDIQKLLRQAVIDGDIPPRNPEAAWSLLEKVLDSNGDIKA